MEYWYVLVVMGFGGTEGRKEGRKEEVDWRECFLLVSLLFILFIDEGKKRGEAAMG